jgi:hypothetical protein
VICFENVGFALFQTVSVRCTHTRTTDRTQTHRYERGGRERVKERERERERRERGNSCEGAAVDNAASRNTHLARATVSSSHRPSKSPRKGLRTTRGIVIITNTPKRNDEHAQRVVWTHRTTWTHSTTTHDEDVEARLAQRTRRARVLDAQRGTARPHTTMTWRLRPLHTHQTARGCPSSASHNS